MGLTRNGARTFLNLMAKACKLSRLPGFRIGIENILGPVNAGQVLALWDPLCALVDLLVASDNYFNQKDFDEDVPGDEDVNEGPPI